MTALILDLMVRSRVKFKRLQIFCGNIWIKVLRSHEKSSNEICPTGKSPKRESSTDTLPVKCLNTSKAMVLEFNCLEIELSF